MYPALLILVLPMPLVAITMDYVCFDSRGAHELAGDVEEAVLPAEIEVAA
ncbi:MAG TPA: hypothetical protein VF025_07060 [Gaiellaceae bacterium]